MATQVDNAIAWARRQIGSSSYNGRCQAFVADCYSRGAGMTRRSAATATQAYKMWCVSKSKTNIPRGAAVYFDGTNPSVGHVGLYIGNGQVIHAAATVRLASLNSMKNYRGWGWNGGVQPTGTSVVNTSTTTANSGASKSDSTLTVTGAADKIQIYHAQNKESIKKYGLLRYFEEIDHPSIAQNKATKLLELYNRKTRELKVTGAFGDPEVRAGTLIPVKLNLGDTVTNNYMLVDKVVHTFTKDGHTMDLTLQGAWKD